MKNSTPDITKPRYQWTEALVFVAALSIIGGSYLGYINWKNDQALAMVNSSPVCDWSTQVPAITPVIEADNLFPNGSLENIDSNGTYPQGWQPNSWGDAHTTFIYNQNLGHTGNRSLEIRYIQKGQQKGDAKWIAARVEAVLPEHTYLFKNAYQSNIETELFAEYTYHDGTQHYQAIAELHATSSWKEVAISFVTPENVASMSLFHSIDKTGFLRTDDYFLAAYQPAPLQAAQVSLTFDDGAQPIHKYALPLLSQYGITSTQFIVTKPIQSPNSFYYITKSQLRDFIQKGHEIGSHTLSHKDLGQSNQSTIDEEITQSALDIYRLTGKLAPNFATPYGSYDQKVINAIKRQYCSHRSTDTGYNSPDNFDLYNIKVQNIEVDTTLEEVEDWLDYAQEYKAWLVIVFHEVIPDGGQFSYDPQHFESILQSIKNRGIQTTTMSEGIQTMQQRQNELNLVPSN